MRRILLREFSLKIFSSVAIGIQRNLSRGQKRKGKRKRNDGVRAQEARIRKLKRRKTRDKGSSRDPASSYTRRGSVVATGGGGGGEVSASRRRDVGLSDRAVGGRAGRRPWNFHVNKISGREYRCLSSARGRRRRRTQKGRRGGEGREESDAPRTTPRRSLYARVVSCLGASPTPSDVEIHPMPAS